MLTPEEYIKVKMEVIKGCNERLKRLQEERAILCNERFELETRLNEIDKILCKYGLEMRSCRIVKSDTQKLLDEYTEVSPLVMQEVGA